jgi:hypothetical protein
MPSASLMFPGVSSTKVLPFSLEGLMLNEQFPIGVLAHILSEKIKAFLHVGDNRLRRRKIQSSFLQELLHEGLDFSLQ